MAQQLRELSQQTKSEVFLVSAYFVPRKQGTRNLQQMSERGIHLRILTNSLASTDVVAVHSGYAPYRKALLRSGIDVYEYRPDAENRALHVDSSARAPRMGLHTKSVIYARKTVYVGSLNLDPRTMKLNTEIGVLIESPELAETIIRLFGQDLLPENSWRLELDKEEMIVWYSDTGKTRREPAYRFWDRISNFFFHLLPLESQL